MAVGESLWLEWHDASGVHRASIADGVSIGRSPQNDITVDDPLVSRQHCTIASGRAGVQVDAHASTNGIEADGVQTKRATLRAGSVLRVGSQVFRVRAGAMPVTSMPAAPVTSHSGLQAQTALGNGPGLAGAVALEWQAGGRVRQRAIARATSIGREPGADIVLDDPAVSRRHAVVSPAGSGVAVDAAQAQNGVSIDGRRLKHASVPMGAAFRIGHTEFRVAPATIEMMSRGRSQRSVAPLIAVLGGVAACLVVGVVVLAVVLRSGGTTNTNGHSTAVATVFASTKITASQGGVVAVAGGPRVTIPPGTFAQDTTVSIRSVPPPVNPKGVVRISGPVYDIDAGGAPLQHPATVELPRTSTASGTFIAYFDPASNEWIPEHSVVSADGRSIIDQVSHFSERAVASISSGAIETALQGDFLKLATLVTQPPCAQSAGQVSADATLSHGVLQGCVDASGNVSIRNLRSFAVEYCFGSSSNCVSQQVLGPGAESEVHTLGPSQTTVQARAVTWSARTGALLAWGILCDDIIPGCSKAIDLATIALPQGPFADELNTFGEDLLNGNAAAALKSLSNAFTSQAFVDDLYGRLKAAGELAQDVAEDSLEELSPVFDALKAAAVGFELGDFLSTGSVSTSTSVTFTYATPPPNPCGVTESCATPPPNPCGVTESCASPTTPPKPRATNPSPSLPKGVWTVAPTNSSTVTGDVLHLEARAYPAQSGGPSISYVNFTLWWAAFGPVSGAWESACAPHGPTSGDTYACDVPLTGVPDGQFKVSFDVYDTSGQRNLSPNGERTLYLNRESEPPATSTPTIYVPPPTATPTATRYIPPPTATPTPPPAWATISIDNPTYYIGDTIQVCYGVSQSGQVVVQERKPDGSVVELLNGLDDGSGGCLNGTAGTPAGTRQVHIDLFGSNGAVIASADASFVVVAPGGNGGDGSGGGDGGSGGTGSGTEAPPPWVTTCSDGNGSPPSLWFAPAPEATGYRVYQNGAFYGALAGGGAGDSFISYGLQDGHVLVAGDNYSVSAVGASGESVQVPAVAGSNGGTCLSS